MAARINIEPCWWTDPRRYKLGQLLGDIGLADGRALGMWVLAQEFWKNDRSMVPKEVFDTLPEAAKLIDCKLARLDGDFVYVRGSSQYLDWTIEERDKRVRGGQVSAQRPRDSKGRLLPKNTEPEPSNDPSEVQVNSKWSPSESSCVQVSGSGSGSGSRKNTTTPSKTDNPTADAAPPGDSIKKKQPTVSYENSDSFVASLPDELLAVWFEKFEEEWVRAELKNCFTHYVLVSTKNKPTTAGGWKRVANAWLERSKNKVLRPKEGVWLT